MKPTSTEHWPFSDPRQPRQMQAEKGIRDVSFHRLQLKGSAPALSCAALSSDLASTPLTQQGSHGLVSCAARVQSLVERTSALTQLGANSANSECKDVTAQYAKPISRTTMTTYGP